MSLACQPALGLLELFRFAVMTLHQACIILVIIADSSSSVAGQQGNERMLLEAG
jgi:hypothetical protein